MRMNLKIILCICLICLSGHFAFRTVKLHSFGISSLLNCQQDLIKAMENARNSSKKFKSPGAGLPTAEEQADAAFGDLINTSMDQQGMSQLSDQEMLLISRGGSMWENGAKTQSRNGGFLGDLKILFAALAGGAHIEKDEFGRT